MSVYQYGDICVNRFFEQSLCFSAARVGKLEKNREIAKWGLFKTGKYVILYGVKSN